MADYTTPPVVQSYLGPSWGPDRPAVVGGGPNTRDSWLASQCTIVSRLFDRLTGRPANWWQSAPGSIREYSGDGSTLLNIDEWDAITNVTMSTQQDRSDAITLSLTPGNANFMAFLPITGPPYNQLFLLRGWLPDVYDIGNIRVTGTPTLPAEISDACAIWVAYRYKRMQAGWADPGRATKTPTAPGPTFSGDIPEEVMDVIKYYHDRFRTMGPKVAMVAGQPGAYGVGPGLRKPLWIGWTTNPP